MITHQDHPDIVLPDYLDVYRNPPPREPGPITTYHVAVSLGPSHPSPAGTFPVTTSLGEAAAKRRAHFGVWRDLDEVVPLHDIFITIIDREVLQ